MANARKCCLFVVPQFLWGQLIVGGEGIAAPVLLPPQGTSSQFFSPNVTFSTEIDFVVVVFRCMFVVKGFVNIIFAKHSD
jgi:hypothetical protein